jgi:hypothetical protein
MSFPKINFYILIPALLWLLAGCVALDATFHVQDRPVHKTHVQMIG